MPFYLAFAIGTVRSARREAATGRGSPPSRKDGVQYPLFRKGAKTARYHIHFGRHETDLYLESKQCNPALGTPDKLRWWVNDVDTTLQGKAS